MKQIIGMIANGDTAETLLREYPSLTPYDIRAALRYARWANRPRPVYDPEALKAAFAEFAEEELALAESDLEHRAQLLHDEDEAELPPSLHGRWRGKVPADFDLDAYIKQIRGEWLKECEDTPGG